jgi:N,N'-diacetyllegionaminate synthase
MNVDEYEQQGRTFVIAEIAQAHDGSVGILHSLVKAAASTGVDAVKFQVHIAEAESSALEPFRIKFSHVDSTRFDYWQRMELPFEQWQAIKQLCDDLGVEFLATPFSNAAVDLLERLNVKRYKVGSGDINNLLLLDKLSQTGKEIILSTGLATLDELDNAISLLKGKKIPYSLLQCTTKYPTEASDIGLPWIAKLRAKYDCPVGLSDHSGKIYAGLGAVALGATVVEAHITFDRRMFGPDAPASLTIDELAQLIEGIRFLEQARGSGEDKVISHKKQDLKQMFGKALAVNRPMLSGDTITFDCLEGKKPADAGISIGEFETVLGKTLACDKKVWEFLQQGDFE